MTPTAPPHVEQVLALIAERSGLAFPEVRRGGAIEAIGAFMAERQLRSDRELASSGQLPALLERLVVHESFFDRDLEQLRFVDEVILPELAQAAPGKLRVWSAACAAGEEAYTLAFMLARRGMFERASVLGTDLSEAALARARAGHYRAWSTRLGSATPAAQYLVATDAQSQVPARFVERVTFSRLNLVEDAYPGGQHLILCRNVLIYFDPRSVEIVATKLAAALDPDGWLVVGPSEPRLDELAPLDLVINDRGLFYRRKGRARPQPAVWDRVAQAAAPAVVPAPTPVRVPPPPPLPVPPSPPRVATSEIRRLADAGDVPRAEALLRAALEARPLDAELHFLHGVLLAENDPAAALAALGRCSYLDPGKAAPQLLAASLWGARGDREAARRAYRAALAVVAKLEPTEVLPWVDDTAGSVTAACRHALEVLDGAR